MKYQLIVRTTAEKDIELAFNWYEDREAGLGKRFVLAVEAAMAILRERPFSWQTVYGQKTAFLISCIADQLNLSGLCRFFLVVIITIFGEQSRFVLITNFVGNKRQWCWCRLVLRCSGSDSFFFLNLTGL